MQVLPLMMMSIKSSRGKLIIYSIKTNLTSEIWFKLIDQLKNKLMISKEAAQ